MRNSLKMNSVIVLSCLLAVSTAFPQDLKVVRPNHYLQQGTFGKEQHLLPESFYTPGQQVEAELRGINIPATQSHQVRETRALQEASAPSATAKEQTAAASSSSSEESAHTQDSYANIGGSSGGVASALTNIHEYGETVPQAFSNLQQDSYAYYHGHKA